MKTLTDKKYTKYVNIITAIAVFSCILLFFIPSSLAEDSIDTLPMQMAESIVSGVSGVIIDTIKGPQNADGVDRGYHTLFVGVTTTSTYADTGLNSTVANLMQSKILRYVAMSWALVIVFSHIALNIGREEDKVQVIFKGMFELCVTMIVLIKVQDIIGMALKLGLFILNGDGSFPGILDAVSYQEGGMVTAADYLREATGSTPEMTAVSPLEKVYCIIMLFIPWLISLGLNVFTRFIMLELLIEIGIRRAFAPLAVVEVYQDGLRSPGFRFLKKLFACFLKIAMFNFIACLVLSLGADVLTSVTGSGHVINGTFAFFAINFAGLGAMKKAGDYSNEITGV